ncbi:MAG: serpin family protein [Parachlamydiaceae bacterium]
MISLQKITCHIVICLIMCSFVQLPLFAVNEERVKASTVSLANDVCALISANDATGKSYAISPISIIGALGMCLNIIKDENKGVFLEKIGLGGLTEIEAHKAIAEALQQLMLPNSFKEGSIDCAQGLAAKENLTFDASFVSLLKEIYNSEVMISNDLMDTVNKWVASKTHNEIKEILSDNTADFVLLNAIYLNLKWADPFEKPETGWSEELFTCTDGSLASVSMMRQEGSYKIYRTDGFSMLEKPYKSPEGRSLSQLIFLPNDKVSLESIEANLSLETIQKCRNAANYEYNVDLKMPKIKAECSLSLLDILKNIGLPLDFLDNSKVVGGEIYIDDILHKTVVSNDEEGTVAAAVTAIIVKMTCCPDLTPPTEFYVNRNYAYAIMDGDTLIFRGRISDPSPLIVDIKEKDSLPKK